MPARASTTATEGQFSLPEMVEQFDFNNIRLGGPVFDLTKLKWLNGEYLRKLTPEEFYAALRSTILSDDYLRHIAPLIQTRIETLGQFGDLTTLLLPDDILPTEDVFLPKKRTLEETLAFAADQLPPWKPPTGPRRPEPALKKLGEEKSWSVKENFMLLRAIITGSTMSPPLLESMVVFGKARTPRPHPPLPRNPEETSQRQRSSSLIVLGNPMKPRTKFFL